MKLVQTDVVVAAHVQACLMAADGLRGPYTVTAIVLQTGLPGLFEMDSHDSHDTYKIIKIIVNNDEYNFEFNEKY